MLHCHLEALARLKLEENEGINKVLRRVWKEALKNKASLKKEQDLNIKEEKNIRIILDN